jgi:hypothetical protein
MKDLHALVNVSLGKKSVFGSIFVDFLPSRALSASPARAYRAAF